MRTYHNPNRECFETGIGGAFNRLDSETDLPIVAAGVGDINGFTTDYLVPWIQGTGSSPPHIRTSMPAGQLFNQILNKDIENTDTTGSWEGFSIKSLDFQNALAFFMIMKGEIQHLNVNDMSIGCTGVLSETRNLYTTPQAGGYLTSWLLSSPTATINTQTGPRFGELGELARDLYGVGGTNSTYGYIDPDETIVSNSTNTYVGITSRTTELNALGLSRAVGLHNRVEYLETVVSDLDSGTTTSVVSEATSDSKTVKLFMDSSRAWSSEFSTGSLDAGTPIAIVSAISDSNIVNVSLQLKRPPQPNVNVSYGDGSDWEVKLRGTARAIINLTQTLQGSEYIATWTVRLIGLADGTATNGITARIPALIESCGASITTSWNSNTYEVSFNTSTGDSNSEIFSNNNYVTRIAAVLSS